MAEPLENKIFSDDHDKNGLHESKRINLKQGLKIISLNINSLYKHLDEFFSRVQTPRRIFYIEHSTHIICLNETKITEEFSDELLKIDGFRNIIRKDCTRHVGVWQFTLKMILNSVSEAIWTPNSNQFL